MDQATRRPHPVILLLSCLFCLLCAGCDRQQSAPVSSPKTDAKPSYAGTVIAAGDSLTAGLGVALEDAWPALLQKKLAENGYNWRVINSGSSGETSSGLLTRSGWLLAQRPEIVIVETGANDGLRGVPVPVIKGNITKIIQLLQSGRVTVILAGMQIVQNLGADYARDFAALYPAVAGERHCLLIPFLLEGVAGNPELNQEDTIHPNEQGHRIIAETVYPYVVQAIQGR